MRTYMCKHKYIFVTTSIQLFAVGGSKLLWAGFPFCADTVNLRVWYLQSFQGLALWAQKDLYNWNKHPQKEICLFTSLKPFPKVCFFPSF